MSHAWWVDQSELDPSQSEVIGLDEDGDYLIIGPPGSGKTNLLLLRANYLCRGNKPDVLILVFTRTLREFIVSGASGYAFSPDKVQTYHGWAGTFLRENGIELQPSGNFEQNRRSLLEQLSNLVDREQFSDLYDLILLDEAHDYLHDEIRLLKRLANNIFLVADDKQQIYRKDQPIGPLRDMVDRTIELRYHYRNGLNICKLADQIMAGKETYVLLEPTSNYDEQARPSRVEHFRCQTFSEQCERIVSEIEVQLRAYPGEMIGIICPQHEELAQLRRFLSESTISSQCVFQDPTSGYVSFDSGHLICVSTLHAAKGLEFRALHFAAVETLGSFKRTNRNMAFTGVTRAKTSLSLYYCGHIYGYLEKALVKLFPRRDRPQISEAFG
jgi:superfamily I DNA/RNA helicase